MRLRLMLSVLAGLSVISGAALAVAPSPYAGWQAREIKALSAAEIDDLVAGRGMGLALAAELNGYPGPRHVLDLADALGLDGGQRAAIQALFDEMSAGAVALGLQLLEAEADLDRLFAEGMVDAAALARATERAAALQGQLRNHHLRYHLSTRDLLQARQLTQYQVLRGYADDRPDHGGHSGHGASE